MYFYFIYLQVEFVGPISEQPLYTYVALEEGFGGFAYTYGSNGALYDYKYFQYIL